MQKLITILFILFIGLTQAQQVELQKSKPFVFTTEVMAIGKGVKTTKFVVVDNAKYYVYQGSRGGLYYIAKNKNGEYQAEISS